MASTGAASTAKIYRENGRAFLFARTGNGWIPDPDVTGRLQRLVDSVGAHTGWRYTSEDDEAEAYDVEGKLISITSRNGLTQTLSYNVPLSEGGDAKSDTLDRVTGPFGRVLTFTYGTQGRLANLTDPDGNLYRYSYGGNANLVSITYPDDTPGDDTDNPKRIYHYEDPNFSHALTGITDETGNRFATWAYDDQGRAILSEHAGGAERVELTYDADGTTTVTDAPGAKRTYTFETHHGVIKVKDIQGGPCPTCGGQTEANAYDANGNIASKTDFNGHVTTYTYDLARNLETSRTEAAGTPEERTTQTQWHADFRLPLQSDVFDRNNTHLKGTRFTYDSVGRVLAQTEIDIASGESRTTANSYNALGLLVSVDGLRTDVADVTTYDYDTQGNRIKTTNALGHETFVTQHDAHGRPFSLTDPNGLLTELAYDARGRLQRQSVDGQVTSFAYDGVGNLTDLTLPTGGSLRYTYDGAHRLTAIQDSAGNTITYTLDPQGNRIQEEVTDPTGALTRTQSRVYDSLNRLLKDIGGEGQESSYAYDANGNRLSAIDGRGHQSTFAFDALNRLLASTDAENGVTEYSYDALDHLTQVKDSKGLETTYTTNALGDLLLLDSPDTGTTGYAYDSAGNRVSQRDAKGVEVNYTYDALNRLTSTDYVDDTLDVSFGYDEGTNGIGRLSTMTDGSGVTDYGYDIRGDLTSVQTTRDGTTHTMGYAYNGADQVMSITYPSGRTVDYQRNALGQISGVTTTLNGETQTLASNIAYAPFGPLRGLTFGNGVPMNRHLDLDYRLTANTQAGILEQEFTFDAADNITAIANIVDLTRDQSLGYDALDRLTGAQGVYGSHSYTYDAVGNRVSQLTDTASETYSYATGSQRLESITGTRTDSFSHDANGNTTEADRFTLGYGQHNRLTEVRLSGVVQARYTHNGRGERVKKEAGGEGVYFDYDPNGMLLAETDTQGQTLKEYLYLERTPLAVAGPKATPSGVYALQGQDPGSGQTFRLTLEPQTRTLSLEGLSGWDGTYRIAPERWRETPDTLLASHTTPSGVRLKVKLVRTADSLTGTLTLTRPPRKARYTLNEATGSGVYSGLEEKTGNTVHLTIDEDTRTLTILEEDQPPRTVTVDPEHWQLKQTKGAKHLRFGAEAAGLTLHGALHVGKDGRVAGHLKLREGERQKSRYALTTRPAPSGPAGLFYIHTDHLGTPQVLSDDNQAIVCVLSAGLHDLT